MSKLENPSAFPIAEPQKVYGNTEDSPKVFLRYDNPEDLGMTLRDYFAAAALTGIVASSSDGEVVALSMRTSEGEEIAAHRARAAITLADAMLKARLS